MRVRAVVLHGRGFAGKTDYAVLGCASQNSRCAGRTAGSVMQRPGLAPWRRCYRLEMGCSRSGLWRSADSSRLKEWGGRASGGLDTQGRRILRAPDRQPRLWSAGARE